MEIVFNKNRGNYLWENTLRNDNAIVPISTGYIKALPLDLALSGI